MAILANQKVLTLDYWKRAEHLKKGDVVFDKDGNPAQVTLVQPYTPKECYEVLFNDYLTLAGDEKMGFIAENRNDRIKESKYKQKLKTNRPLRNKKIKDLLEEPLHNTEHHYFEYSVRTTPPISLPAQLLPVPPFVFGFWFINRKRGGYMVAPLGTADMIYEQFMDAGYAIKETNGTSSKRRRFITTPSIRDQLAPFVPYKIPGNYMMAAPDQRIELLRGILHAKKSCYNKATDNFRFTVKDATIAKQIQWLVESLGHKTALTYNPIIKSYIVTFKSKLKLMTDQDSKPLKWAYGRRYIRKITKIDPAPCVHIETNGANGTMLVGEGFIACH